MIVAKICEPDVQTPFRASGLKWKRMVKKMREAVRRKERDLLGSTLLLRRCCVTPFMADPAWPISYEQARTALEAELMGHTPSTEVERNKKKKRRPENGIWPHWEKGGKMAEKCGEIRSFLTGQLSHFSATFFHFSLWGQDPFLSHFSFPISGPKPEMGSV